MVVWLIFGLYKPYTGGCAADGELMARGLSRSSDVQRVIVVTEYCTRQLWISDGKVLLLRLLPRRDSREFNGPLRRLLTFSLEHIILLLLLIFLGVFRRRDIVHFHSRLIYPWTALAVRLLRTRAVADVRDNFARLPSVDSFPLAAFVSQQVGEGLCQVIAERKLKHVPVPLDQDELVRLGACPTRLRPAYPYFLFVGAIHASKGIPELLDAYREYRRLHGPASPALILVGQNYLQRDGSVRDIEPSLMPGVRTLGSIAREYVYPLMAGADRLLLPSRSEGMPRVCLEAMALNVPVVLPPHVREFERYCPACVLPEISPIAILQKLQCPREDLIVKDYPLHRHDCQAVINSFVEIYRHLADLS